MGSDLIAIGTTVYVVDRIDNGEYTLCRGVVDDVNYHTSKHAHVVWDSPKREPSYRHTLALSTNPVVAIVSRRDLGADVLQAVEQDAKERGLLAE